MSLTTGIQSLRAGLGEAIQGEGAKPHPARPPIEHVTQNPISCALWRDPQIKATAIGMHAGFFQPFDFQCCEPTDRPCHSPSHPGYNYVHNN